MRSMPLLFCVAAAVVGGGALVLSGCASGSDGNPNGSGGDGGGAAGGSDTGGAGGAGASGGGLNIGGGQGGDTTELIAEVFGHSADTLYRLDPDTKAVGVVAVFSGCDNVVDIALDKDSGIIGTTQDGIYRIDKDTAVCTLIATGSYPNSLSFVPVGTVDANVEALVGYLDADYVRIDPTSGAQSTINVGALTNGLISSGDIVSVKDGKTYLTVKAGSCNDTDCLIEVDPATGTQLKMWGDIGFNNVFGIAFWAGRVYGFTSEGDLFEIAFDGGILSTAPIPTPPGIQFWGAGSTTSAPPDPIAE